MRRDPYALLEPAWHSMTPYEHTFGPEVGAFCAQVGMTPDPEQQLVLNDALAVDEFGLPISFEYGIVAVRQQMKTGVLKMLALGWLYVLKIDDIAWSAHLVYTALAAHDDLAQMIRAHPVLRKRLPPGRTNGITASKTDGRIELTGGLVLRFAARTEGGGRGLTGKRVIMDEAFGLSPGMLGALLPTMTAMEDAQAVYASTPGKLDSVALRNKRDAGRAGGEGSIGWAEWCAPFKVCEADEGDGEACSHWPPGHPGHVAGCALDDESLWQQAMPLLGRRRSNGTGLSLQRVRELRRSMPPDEFRREMLGWWDDPGESAIFGAGVWEERLASWTDGNGVEHNGFPEPADFKPSSFGIAVAADFSAAAIVGAGLRGDTPALRVVATGPGHTWVPGRLKALRKDFPATPIVFDAGGPAGVMEQAVRREVKPERRLKAVNFGQWIAACGGIYTAVTEGTVEHGGQYELDESVRLAEQRRIKDRKVWERYGYNAAPLEAATLALWGMDNAKPTAGYNPQKGLLTV